MQLVPLTEYTADQLHVGLSTDGPCLMADGTFALIVSLRGKDGGAMPSPSELRWSRDVPDRMKAAPTHLFLRRDREERSALYLGTIMFERTGRPAKDGFKILFRLSDAIPEPAWRDFVAAATAPPPPDPEEAIAGLTAESTTADRIAALRVFIERWYGPTAASGERALPANFPEPLRVLYELARGRTLFAQNKLKAASDLAVEDGKLTFYVENQGVCEWAIEPGKDDPPVLVRGNEWGDPWNEEAPTLSGFLIQAVIFETVLGAAHFSASTDGADADELRKLKCHVKPIALPPWARSMTTFLASNGIVGFASKDADLYRIELAAHDKEPFDRIEDVVSDWPNIGF